MRNIKIAGLAACTAIAAILAGSSIAYAEGSSTTITAIVPEKTDYTMTIPAATSVTNYGWTDLKNGLKISGTLADGYKVEVSISSKYGSKFYNENNKNEIAYALKHSQASANAVDKITVQKKNLDTAISLGVDVSQDAWNAVPGGEYSDILTFTAATVEAGD